MIGWITTWGIKCGIATYSRFLIEEMDDDVLILCQSEEGNPEGAIPCWKRDSNLFSEMIDQFAPNEIDTVVIQHQPGLLRFSYLNQLLLKLAEMNIKVFITMHNTRDKSILFRSRRIERAVEGLKTCSTVMVHSKADVENLEKLGIKTNVVMIPHGIYPPPSESVEALPLNGRVLGTFGFLLPHKGQIELVEAFEQLSGWDELLLLCATRKDSEKTEKRINSLIKEKGLEERVRFVTEFLDDEIAIATLSKCDLLAFPYQRTNESASGAVRMGVASGTPIAVSPIHIFDDIKGAIKMRGKSVDDIVASISTLSEKDLESSRKSIIEFRDSLQWSEVAKRIQGRLN